MSIFNHREQLIKEFWDKQAKVEGQKATNEDTYYRSLEVRQVLKQLKDSYYVLDVGCGNGFSTKQFALARPQTAFTGMDYSHEMIQEALKGRQQGTVNFFVGNVLDMHKHMFCYDTIISTRCLINLMSFKEQKQAICQLKPSVAKSGKMIIVENTIDGLNRLNKVRNWLGLHSIQVRWHNLYIPHDEFVAFLKEHFEHVESRNIGTPYYILSRIVYAKYCQLRGIEPRYDNWINRIACKLPSITGWWMSPNHMFICKGKK